LPASLESCKVIIYQGEPLHETLEMQFNLKAMAILDAGIRSAASGKLELVNSETWAIVL